MKAGIAIIMFSLAVGFAVLSTSSTTALGWLLMTAAFLVLAAIVNLIIVFKRTKP